MRLIYKHRAVAVLVLVVLVLLVVAQQFRLLERAWFNLQNWQDPARHATVSMGLAEYRVEIEAKPIVGLNDDVSGLTYDPQRKSLYTVTNDHAQLIELSLSGEVLRRIVLRGFGDAEAVEYISAGTFVIADERRQRLIQVTLDEHTTELDAEQWPQLSLGIGLNGNKGFEGLAYDSVGQRLFVAKERNPLRIFEIHGFPQLDAQQPLAVHVVGDHLRDGRLFVRDLSSLQYDERSGHLLTLSDESRLVLELDVTGKPLSSLSLLAGNSGLSKTVPQGEGMAMDDDGVLYLVSEPNLFYRFARPAAQ
ncbi:SdiA-regulated domain-containing protein [Pseudomonas sp. 5P_3.1_Bac2]|nr:SdiA-regulated domain-containing protein [Pseudomonas sp. 5P_3.1_Bac2]MCU1718033.1 SdiA-regulated domain-containing protein [Pseudomonas sp. 5P_3.1_Bac2]